MRLGQPILDPVGLATVALLSVVAYRIGALDVGGFVAGLGIGYAVWLGGGIRWFPVLVLFMALASYTTRLRYEEKQAIGVAQEKGGARGWRNALANGGIAAAAGVFEFASPSEVFLAMFVGSLAAAGADTLATEVGLLSRTQPRLVVNPWLKVSAGTSGGITYLGAVAAAGGALAISATAAALSIDQIRAPAIAIGGAVGGLIGSFADSFIGATLQGHYRCGVCQRVTELPVHCSSPATKVSGFRWIGNNVVNLLATAVGGALALTVFLLIAL